jgi:hypothetical protein
MKLLLSMVAAAIVAGMLSAAPAEARCWFNRHIRQCSHPMLQHPPPHRFLSPSLGY